MAYERLRREKLECQLDEYRADMDQLKEMLKKIQAPSVVAMVGVLNTFIFLHKQYLEEAKIVSFGLGLDLNPVYNLF